MIIKVISDIHLENRINPPFIGKGDLLVLAGNILIAKHLKIGGELKEKYLDFFNECLQNYKNVLYVMGNYEHYGYHYDKTYNTIKENIPESIKLLENEKVLIDDWVFIGMTMWTNFDGNKHKMYRSETLNNDYELIRIGSDYRKIKPTDILKINNISEKYLNKNLKLHRKDKVFIITHHAPSIKSIHKEDLIFDSYYTDLTKIINRNPQIKYWVHGHINHKNDYIINKCNILSSIHGSSIELNLN